MPDCLNQPDELPFVSSEASMAWRYRPTEKPWSSTLMQDGTKPCTRRVTLDDEGLREIWKLQCWGRRESVLERPKCALRIIGPSERCLLEEACEGRRDDAKPLDETPIVSGEAEETA